MTATTRNADVARFVAAVREALDDLSPDELDELTGGLEADLDDELADDPTAGVDRFGAPSDYAAELRAAAGLPSRAARGARRGAGSLADRVDGVQRAWQERAGRVRAQRWWAPTRDFLVTLRPVWWVARGWVACWVVRAFFGYGGRSLLPSSLLGLVFLGAFVVASVQLGRRWTPPPGRARRWALAGGNTLAWLLLLPLLGAAQQGVVVIGSGSVQEVPPSNGLWLNGTEVRNVFPYDAGGRPLTDVQLFDERGHALAVGDSAQTPLLDGTGQREVRQVPARDANNRPVWNVYPLRQQDIQPNIAAGPDPAATAGEPVGPPVPATRPLQTLLPVAPASATATPAGSPAPTGSAPSGTAPAAAGNAPSGTGPRTAGSAPTGTSPPAAGSAAAGIPTTR